MNKILLATLLLLPFSAQAKDKGFTMQGCLDVGVSRADCLEVATAIAEHINKKPERAEEAEKPRNRLVTDYSKPQSEGVRVYKASECVGTVIMGVCHGGVISTSPPKVCHGTMLNGQCTGPMF